MSQPPDPDETVPFTHQPYGSGGGDNPFTSPSGPASQPSGPSYAAPDPGPPQAASQPSVPYGTYIGSAYGAPYAGAASHKSATTAMVLGIVAVTCLVLTPFCCVTLPGLFCAPFAWVIGTRAKREIDAQPGVYGNRSSAQAGVVMGIIGTVLGFLMIAGFVAIAVWVGVTDFSLV